MKKYRSNKNIEKIIELFNKYSNKEKHRIKHLGHGVVVNIATRPYAYHICKQKAVLEQFNSYSKQFNSYSNESIEAGYVNLTLAFTGKYGNVFATSNKCDKCHRKIDLEIMNKVRTLQLGKIFKR